MPGRVQELTEQLLRVIDSEGNVRRVSGSRAQHESVRAAATWPPVPRGRHFNVPSPAAGSGHGGGGNGRIRAGENPSHGGGPQGEARDEPGVGERAARAARPF